jgi:hypothetical protein
MSVTSGSGEVSMSVWPRVLQDIGTNKHIDLLALHCTIYASGRERVLSRLRIGSAHTRVVANELEAGALGIPPRTAAGISRDHCQFASGAGG